MVAFIVLAFLLGGGSRADIQSLVILRPLAIVCAAFAICNLDRQKFRALGLPFWLLLSLTVWIAVHLIPLPPAVWQSLPGREIYSGIENLAGIEASWRPISLSPFNTWNSLFAMSIPIATYLLYSIQTASMRREIFLAIAMMGLVSLFLALLQILGDGRGSLYFYRITNFNLPVGLFANRNHQAALIALLIPTLVLIATKQRPRWIDPRLLWIIAIIAIIVTIPLLFLTGSRAGIILGAAAVLFSIYLYQSLERTTSMRKAGSNQDRYLEKKGPNRSDKIVKSRRLLWAGIVAILSLVAAILYFSRTKALDRFFEEGDVDELRMELLPYLIDMVSFYFPVGSGFGTFDLVYRRFEPMELLNSSYLNHAHNDWIQILIEGGVPALLIIVAFACWLVFRISGLFFARDSVGQSGFGLKALASFVLVGLIAVSAVDYPLRVPSLMVVFTICVAILDDRTISEKLR